jgi:hypothetical protein
MKFLFQKDNAVGRSPGADHMDGASGIAFIVRGNAVGQLQKVLEPVKFSLI